MDASEKTLDVIAYLYFESGLSIEDGEYSIFLRSIESFDINYVDELKESVHNWVSNNIESIKQDSVYELYMTQYTERDRAGAITDRGFEVVRIVIQEFF